MQFDTLPVHCMMFGDGNIQNINGAVTWAMLYAVRIRPVGSIQGCKYL